MSAFDTPPIPAELDRRLRDVLEDGEQLLWVAQPVPARLAMKMLPVGFVGLIAGLFVTFWALSVFVRAHSGDSTVMQLLFPYFGAPFVIVSAIMIASPFAAFGNARKTIYGVTDRRALIAGGVTRTVRSFRGGDILGVRLVNRGNGIGDVLFSQSGGETDEKAALRLGNTLPIGFYGVARPQDAERLVQNLIDGGGGTQGKNSDGVVAS